MFKMIKLLIFFVIIAVLGVMFLPLGSVEFKDPEMMATLVVPSFSMFEDEDITGGNYVANFQTVRSEWALRQELDKIMDEKYVKYTCPNDEIVYYDQKNYITIYGYTIESGLPFSKYSIEYGRGNQCGDGM